MPDIVSQYFTAFSARDLEGITSLFSPNVVLHDSFAGKVESLPNVTSVYREIFSYRRLELKMQRGFGFGSQAWAQEFELQMEDGSGWQSLIAGVDCIEWHGGAIQSIRAYVEATPIPTVPASFNGDCRIRDARRIDKPWGYENLVARNSDYALKEIFLKAGMRSSLQSHRMKRETIFVLSGAIQLETADGEGRPRIEIYNPQEAYSIPPGVKHRAFALADSIVHEVSTPELDDLIRHQDDFGRGNKGP